MSSSADNRSLVRRYFQEIVNNVNTVAAEQVVSPSLVLHSPYTPQPTRDRESFIGMLQAVHAAFPDFDLVDHDTIAEGDRVATRWTVHGTHLGELAGIAPTGRKLAISG